MKGNPYWQLILMYFVLIVINTLFSVICATLDLFTKFRTKLFQESFNIQMLM